MDRERSLINPLASVTRTVMLLVLAVVGMPLITPVDAFRLKPTGSTPTVIDQVSGDLPPLAVSVVL